MSGREKKVKVITITKKICAPFYDYVIVPKESSFMEIARNCANQKGLPDQNDHSTLPIIKITNISPTRGGGKKSRPKIKANTTNVLINSPPHQPIEIVNTKEKNKEKQKEKENNLSKLEGQEGTETVDFITRRGFKGPVTIVKVRKNAAFVLYRSLIENEFDNLSQFKNNIPIFCENLKVFDTAIEDEDENDSRPTTGLTRKNLNDQNPGIKSLDILMLNIIIDLLNIIKQPESPYYTKAKIVICDFIMVSSGKEYLDIGQLYAIIKPTIYNNLLNGWGHHQIIGRYHSLPENEVNFSATDFPRKAMLESDDGAATRIASNSFYTAYCCSKLEQRTLPFFMDNGKVNLLAQLLNTGLLDATVNDFENNISEHHLTVIKETITYIQHFSNFDDPTQIYKIIDVMYVMLEQYRAQLKYINSVVRSANGSIVIIEPKYYYIMSVVCFLFRTNKAILKYNPNFVFDNNVDLSQIPDIDDDLIVANLDSLCHDNGKSAFYRIIMVLMFIIKNDENIIINILNELYPETFSEEFKNIGNYNKLPDEIQYVIGNETTNTNIVNYINSLGNKLILIFHFLANNNYECLQDALYRRLLNKTSYIFEINDKDKLSFALVDCENSAKYVENKITSQRIDILGSQLTPYYTNAAVDLPLSTTMSVTQTDLSTFHSQVWETSVTRVDAASQNKTYSKPYTDPICITINILDGKFTFTYIFYYGKIITDEIKQQIEAIDCGDTDSEICDTLKKLLIRLENTSFYLSKRNTREFKNKIEKIFYNRMKTLQDIKQKLELPADKQKITNIIILFTNLVVKAICGEKPPNGKDCGDKTTTSKIIDSQKQTFKQQISDILKDNTVSNYIKQIINITLNELLDITSETKDIDNLFKYQNEPVSYPQPNRKSMAFTASNTNVIRSNNSGLFKKPFGGRVKGLFQSPVQNVEKKNWLVPQNVKEDTSIIHFDKGKGKNSIINQNEIIVTPSSIKNVTIKFLPTLFGKYGFEIMIDDENKYVLIPLDTPEQYGAYLKKYQIIDPTFQIKEETQMTQSVSKIASQGKLVTEPISQVTTETQLQEVTKGGKLRTKKLRNKFKKTKNKKNKTKKYYKRQTKRHTRKKINYKNKHNTKKH